MSAFVFLFVIDCAKYQLHRRKNSRCVGPAMDFWKSEAFSIIDFKKLLNIGLLLFKHDFIFIAKLNLFVRSGINLMFEPLSLFAVICNLTLQFFSSNYHLSQFNQIFEKSTASFVVSLRISLLLLQAGVVVGHVKKISFQFLIFKLKFARRI